MFKEHYDNMRPGPTPERVLAVSKLAACINGTRDEVIKASLLYTQNSTASEIDTIRKSIDTAKELGILEEKDGTIKSIVDDKVLSNYMTFRKYVSNCVFSVTSTTFFKVTEWYITKNEKVMDNEKWEVIAASAVSDGIENISENDILGWRFWASFLGIGYIHNKILIPNMYIRICDLIEQADWETNNRIPANDFVKWLYSKAPECKINNTETTPSLAMSNGLRTLHEQDKIELIVVPDTNRVKLYPIDGYPINDFSHVVIKGGNE
jgi:hypothetical protein